MFVCFYSLWSDLCVLRLIFNKDSKGSLGSCETFSLSSSLLFNAQPHRLQASLASHLTSVLHSDFSRNVDGSLDLQLQRENCLKAESCGVIRLTCVSSFTRGTQPWNPNTACCSGYENSCLMYFVQLSNSHWQVRKSRHSVFGSRNHILRGNYTFEPIV